MKLTHLVLAGLGSVALFTMTPAQAQIITQWTFENDSIATNNSPAASTGTGTADAIGMTNTYPNALGNSTNSDDVVQGATSDTGSNTVADLTKVWRVRGKSPGNGWNSAAAIATQGAQFFTSTAGTTTGAINVSFDWYSTTQGEANLTLEYTTNGGITWTPLSLSANGSDAGLQLLTNTTSVNTVQNVTYASDNLANNAQAGQDWFTDLTATITDPNALNDSGFGIEMVNASTGVDDLSTQGSALNNTSGNWRFDNVTISAVATPEPSSWLLGASALALFFVLRRSRRETARR